MKRFGYWGWLATAVLLLVLAVVALYVYRALAL